MEPCRICGKETKRTYAINFGHVRICLACSLAVTYQTVNDLGQSAWAEAMRTEGIEPERKNWANLT